MYKNARSKEHKIVANCR